MNTWETMDNLNGCCKVVNNHHDQKFIARSRKSNDKIQGNVGPDCCRDRISCNASRVFIVSPLFVLTHVTLSSECMHVLHAIPKE